MKKLFAVCLAAGFMSLVACGPSAEEQAQREKELQEDMTKFFEKAESDINSAVDSMNNAAGHDTTSHEGHSH